MTPPRSNLALGDRIAIAVAVVSTGALLLELTLPHRLEAPARSEEPLSETPQEASDTPPVGPVSEYLAVAERPLFTQDRRPFVAAAEPERVAPAGPRVEFELTAVIITSATRMALLRSNVAPAARRVALNQTVDGWTLAQVTPNAVVLQRGSESVTVPLRPDLRGARAGQAARADGRSRRN